MVGAIRRYFTGVHGGGGATHAQMMQFPLGDPHQHPTTVVTSSLNTQYSIVVVH